MNQVVQTRRALNHFICTKLSTHQCTSFQHRRLKKIACILIRENKNPCKIHITPRRTKCINNSNRNISKSTSKAITLCVFQTRDYAHNVSCKKSIEFLAKPYNTALQLSLHFCYKLRAYSVLGTQYFFQLLAFRCNDHKLTYFIVSNSNNNCTVWYIYNMFLCKIYQSCAVTETICRCCCCIKYHESSNYETHYLEAP